MLQQVLITESHASEESLNSACQMLEAATTNCTLTYFMNNLVNNHLTYVIDPRILKYPVSKTLTHFDVFFVCLNYM